MEPKQAIILSAEAMLPAISPNI
jgi:amino acid transporter